MFHSIWQELILRLNKENGWLKQNLDATNSPRDESSKSSANGTNDVKVVIGMLMKNYEQLLPKIMSLIDCYIYWAVFDFVVVCVRNTHFFQ